MKFGKHTLWVEFSHGWQLGLLGRVWRVRGRYNRHWGLDLELPIITIHIELVTEVNDK